MDAERCWACAHVGGVRRGATGDLLLVCSPDVSPPDPDGTDPMRTPVTRILRPEVHCVRSTLHLAALVELFTDERLGATPVVDGDARPIGVVTKTDLLRALERGSPAALEHTVEQVMTPLAFSLPDDASVAQAAALMAFEDVDHVPVLSSEGRVVGLVSSLDVARFVGWATGYLRAARP